MEAMLLPEVLDDGLCFRLTPDDGVLFDRAAHFVFCGEHPAHISVGTKCDHTGLLSNERQCETSYFNKRDTTSHSSPRASVWPAGGAFGQQEAW